MFDDQNDIEEEIYPYLDVIGSFTAEPKHLVWLEGLDSLKKYAVIDVRELQGEWSKLNKLIEYITMRTLNITMQESVNLCITKRPYLVYKNCDTEKEAEIRYIISQ